MINMFLMLLLVLLPGEMQHGKTCSLTQPMMAGYASMAILIVHLPSHSMHDFTC